MAEAWSEETEAEVRLFAAIDESLWKNKAMLDALATLDAVRADRAALLAVARAAERYLDLSRGNDDLVMHEARTGIRAALADPRVRALLDQPEGHR